MNARRACVAVACAFAIIPALGCGGDSSSLSSEYCAAVARVFQHDNGLRGEDDPALIKAAYAKVLRALGPALTTIAEDGPEEAQRASRGLRALYAESAEKGTDAFDGEVGRLSTVVRVSADGCGWPAAQVTASDYAFTMPETFDSGPVVLRLENRSEVEPHLVLLMRVKDGVEKSLDDLLAQFGGPETANADFEFVDGGAFAFPGQTAYGMVDLKPGRYLYACPIPVEGGASYDDNHMRHGMRGEFRVP